MVLLLYIVIQLLQHILVQNYQAILQIPFSILQKFYYKEFQQNLDNKQEFLKLLFKKFNRSLVTTNQALFLLSLIIQLNL